MINKKELSLNDLKYYDPYAFGYLKNLKYGADICKAPPKPRDRSGGPPKRVATRIAVSG